MILLSLGLGNRRSAVSETIRIAVGLGSALFFGWGELKDENVSVLSNPSSGMLNNAVNTYFNSVAWDPSGVYLAVSFGSVPYLRIFKRENNTLNLLTTPVITSNGRGVAWSKSGKYLAVTHQTSPYMTVYRRSGDSFVKLANPTTLPTKEGCNCIFTPDEARLIVSYKASPFIRVYDINRDMDTLTNVNGHGIAPGNVANAFAFTPDGQYLLVGISSGNFGLVYGRSGNKYTQISSPFGTPKLPGAVFSLSVSGDGTKVLVVYEVKKSRYVRIFDGTPGNWINNTLISSSNDPTNPYRAVFSEGEDYVFSSIPNAPYLSIMKFSPITNNYQDFGLIPNFPSVSPGAGYGLAVHPSSLYK